MMTAAEKKVERLLVAGEVPGHLESNAEEPLSRVLNPQIGPCDELATRPGCILPTPSCSWDGGIIVLSGTTNIPSMLYLSIKKPGLGTSVEVRR